MSEREETYAEIRQRMAAEEAAKAIAEHRTYRDLKALILVMSEAELDREVTHEGCDCMGQWDGEIDAEGMLGRQ